MINDANEDDAKRNSNSISSFARSFSLRGLTSRNRFKKAPSSSVQSTGNSVKSNNQGNSGNTIIIFPSAKATSASPVTTINPNSNLQGGISQVVPGPQQ